MRITEKGILIESVYELRELARNRRCVVNPRNNCTHVPASVIVQHQFSHVMQLLDDHMLYVYEVDTYSKIRKQRKIAKEKWKLEMKQSAGEEVDSEIVD